MKNKKIALSIFTLILLSFLIPILSIKHNFVSETQNSLNDNLEVRKAATKTAILRPNGDILTEWDGSPTPHWSRINEVNYDYVQVKWIDGDENQTEIYAMENLDIINFINVTRIELHAIGHRAYSGPAFVSIYLGEWTSKLELNLPTSSYDWRTCVWNNLNGTYEDLMDLQVNISAGVWCDSSGYGLIDTLYCNITYDIAEFTGDTATLRPNEDVLIEWDGDPTPHWSRINEISPNGVYARWIDGDENQSDIFGMQDVYFENAIVTSVELHVYGDRFFTGPAFASIYLGERTSKLELNLPTAGPGWRTCFWNNLDGTYEDLKDLQVNITAGVWCDSGGFGRINTMYCVVTIEQPFQVTTPENKTYTEPMTGYYPATYGFENDNVGDNPFNWETIETGGPIEVMNSLDNHFNVVKLDDNIGELGYDCILTQNFTSQIVGSIEFYFRLDSLGTLGRAIRLQNKSSDRAIHLKVANNEFQYRDSGNNWHTFYQNFQTNKWYHVRIDFNCITHAFDIFIDNIQKGMNLEFANPINYIENICFITGQYAIVEMHLDAIGYSWDPNYNIGDNLYEGLLLGYTTNFIPDWIKYSLDAQSNRTILGNTTIALSFGDGSHSIQLFGNDSFGNNYYSDIVYFYIDLNNPIITIISPSSDDFAGHNAPDYEINVVELSLNSTWYNINNGINITIELFTGSINQTVWDGYGEGTITINFCANDTWGHEGYSEVSIFKDLTPPTSIIAYTPYRTPNIVIESTNFAITATDGSGSGVTMIQYKINDSSWMSYSDPFDLTSYSPGYYLISYRAIDNVGNVEIENSIVIKLEVLPSSEDLIPLIITVSAISGGAIFGLITIYWLIRRKREP